MSLIRVLCVMLLVGSAGFAADPLETRPLTLIVMDPLAGPLACDCVQGYAQRKYEVLGTFLSRHLQRPVKVFWSESLVKALEEKSNGQADLIIGKHSVVLHDAQAARLAVKPIASLTGTDGSTSQTGLFVVRTNDPAQTVADLAGYRIFFGPADCDEKSAAPMALLARHHVPLPSTLEVFPACSNAATRLVELDPGVKAAAVISSYAGPLLEGCGTIKKGDLRVIGASEPVPFVVAFVHAALPESEQAAIRQTLLQVGTDPDLLIALETAEGFVEFQPLPTPGATPAEQAGPAVSRAGDLPAGDGTAPAQSTAKKKN